MLITLIGTSILGYGLFIEYREKPYDDYIFTVSIKTDNREVIIYPYQTYDDYYFFLPSYAKNVETYIVKNNKYDFSLNDIKLESKNKILDFKENTKYDILEENKNIGTLTIMYGSNIPSVFIDTNDGNIDEVKNNKNLQKPSSLLVVNNGSIDYDNSIEFITGRGNHSWDFDKKGWSIKLLESAPILGMKNFDEWILTSNAFDDALGIRNFIAFDMAQHLQMEGTSDFRFVDLYIDKFYQGTYILFERISQSKEKFDIGDLDLLNRNSNKTIELNKLNPVEIYNDDSPYKDRSYREFNSPSNISGGYIIERNVKSKTRDKEHLFTTLGEETFVVRYPSFVNKEELEYIEDVVKRVDRALHADDYVDPITHKKLDELIDMDSFVLKYLVDEVTKNEGAGATSAYYYKKQNDDKLYAGPIWDYDKSLGRFSQWTNPEGIANGILYKAGTPSDWFEQLYFNEEANLLIRKYYKEIIKPYLSILYNSLLDNQVEKIRNSYEMNNILWGDKFYDEEYYLQADLIEHVGDFDYSVDYIKWWLKERESFLDKEWE